MSSQFQTIAALVVVALAVTWLVARAVRKRRQPGCGGDCGCPSRELKR
ncbi:MAG: FeoB-associated Cys-rich membrane protein [Opitutaceae bacterium]|nr:FeoB-associated Cys-rich membrane protein [Opitutaceae bacterium]